jgi:hypothetical protein
MRNKYTFYFKMYSLVLLKLVANTWAGLGLRDLFTHRTALVLRSWYGASSDSRSSGQIPLSMPSSAFWLCCEISFQNVQYCLFSSADFVVAFNWIYSIIAFNVINNENVQYERNSEPWVGHMTVEKYCNKEPWKLHHQYRAGYGLDLYPGGAHLNLSHDTGYCGRSFSGFPQFI